MNDRVATVVDDEDDLNNPFVIESVTLGPAHVSNDTGGEDPFLMSGEEAKALRGVSAATKRKVSTELRKFQRGVGEAESKKVDYDAITGYQAFDVVQPPYNLDYLAKLYEVSSPHYSAVNAKVNNIVGLGYDLVETSKAKRKLEDLEGDQLTNFQKKMSRAKDDLLDRLESMNEEDTFTEVLAKAWTDFESTGNGYIEIGRTARGDIGYIGHIPSRTMRVRRQRDGFVQIISNQAVFFRHLGDTETKDPIGNDTRPNEVIHLKNYSPTNSYYGIPDIIAAKNAVAGNEFADRYNLDYFENKAVPRYIVILKGAKLSSAAERQVIEFFETGLKGRNHRTLYVPLPSGTKDNPVEFRLEPVEAKVQDSSFTNYNKHNLDSILMAHGVPVTKVGIPTGVNLAIARDADKTFKEQVCQPKQKILEKKLNKFFKEFTDIFSLKLNELTLTDADTQSKIDERNVRNGIDLPNEVRARRGMPGIEGGDKSMPLTAQQAADRKATAQQTRARDSARSASASDSAGEARQPKGDGRAAP